MVSNIFVCPLNYGRFITFKVHFVDAILSAQRIVKRFFEKLAHGYIRLMIKALLTFAEHLTAQVLNHINRVRIKGGL